MITDEQKIEIFDLLFSETKKELNRIKEVYEFDEELPGELPFTESNGLEQAFWDFDFQTIHTEYFENFVEFVLLYCYGLQVYSDTNRARPNAIFELLKGGKND